MRAANKPMTIHVSALYARPHYADPDPPMERMPRVGGFTSPLSSKQRR
jgi:hypothetical protein